LVAALLESWYHDQSRPLSIALAIGLSVWGWRSLPNGADLAHLAIIFLLPLNFVLFECLSDRGVLGLSGVVSLALVGAQVPLIDWLSSAKPSPARELLYWGKPASSAGWTWLPRTEILSFSIALLVLLYRAFRGQTRIQQALPWTLLAVFLGFNQRSGPESLFLYAGAAGLILIVAVLEHGYHLATRDELTGLPGRRAFNRVVEQLGRQYAIAMCDIDHFKQFNDLHGHEGGDQVLKMVAATIAKVSGGGQAFRYGGEEFAIIFAGCSAKDAAPCLERLRQEIASRSFVLRSPNRPERKPRQRSLAAAQGAGSAHSSSTAGGAVGRDQVVITISVGLAEQSKRHSTPELVLEAADRALYHAKESGRNCVKLDSDSSSQPAVLVES
jgi:diguanylate cyclase (GGDEF)-like protein